MTGIRIALAALGLAALTVPALAQQQAGQPGDKLLPPPEFVAGKQSQPLDVDMHPVNVKALSAADKATLDQIDAYFNSLKFISGNFVQVGADGRRITGKFWVSKPGRMRFDYDAPSPLQLLADGTSVAVRNRKLNTQDLYLIRQTPLRFLLANRLDLIEDSKVLAVGKEPSGISVLLEEGSSIGGKARIQLSLPAPDFKLKQWTITDAQGYDTTVTISDIDTDLKLPDKIFYIDQTRILR